MQKRHLTGIAGSRGCIIQTWNCFLSFKVMRTIILFYNPHFEGFCNSLVYGGSSAAACDICPSKLSSCLLVESTHFKGSTEQPGRQKWIGLWTALSFCPWLSNSRLIHILKKKKKKAGRNLCVSIYSTW